MEAANSLVPRDLICLKILPRLPAKSLMRFKCVCKSWSSLTSNPSFLSANQNFRCNRHTHILLITMDKTIGEQHYFSVQINQEGIINPASATPLLSFRRLPNQVWCSSQSINGLVFCNLSSFLEPKFTSITILNPGTRKFISVENANSKGDVDTTAGHITHHFGFSPLTNEYKVLQICQTRISGFVLKIFTLGTSSWRDIKIDMDHLPFDPQKCNLTFDRKTVPLNGAIHWMHEDENVIVVFDLGDERFRVIPLPDDDDISFGGYIIEVGGCLALIAYYMPLLPGHNSIELWMLKDYHKQVWIKESILFPNNYIKKLGYPVVLCMVHTGELLLHCDTRESRDHGWLLLYNMETKSYRKSKVIFPIGLLTAHAQLLSITSCDDSIYSSSRSIV